MATCHKCKKCFKHWSGEHGENNANECCKFKDWKQILEEREYWEKVKCFNCGEFMIKWQT